MTVPALLLVTFVAHHRSSERCDVAGLLLEAMNMLRVSNTPLQDRASYIKMVKHIILYVDSSQHGRLFSMPFLAFEYAPQLGVHDCFEVLDYSLRQTCRVGIFTKLPGAEYLTPGQMHGLMELCMRKLRAPSPAPYHIYEDDDWDDGCSSCGHKWQRRLPSLQMAVADLAELPSAVKVSEQELARLIRMSLLHEEGPQHWVLCALLRLPAARHIHSDAAGQLFWIAFQHGALEAVHLLCQYLPACAAVVQRMDAQSLLQHMDAVLHDTEADPYNMPHQLQWFLSHPSLQQQAKQILPDLLLSAVAVSEGSEHGLGRSTERELRVLLKLPAAHTLSAAVVRKLMQHSIVQTDGALLPTLVRLPAAAQLQQRDVAVLLQAALGYTCSLGETAAHASPSTAAGWSAHEGRQEAPRQQQDGGQARGRTQHQQRGRRKQSGGRASAAQEVLFECPPLPELIQECLQCRTATAHLIQLLTLPLSAEAACSSVEEPPGGSC
jgi:hypothetical protein